MAEENISLETLLSKLVLIQSKLEYEANALESLILVARSQAENENSDLIYLLDTLQNKAKAIKNTVYEITEN